MIKDLKKKKDKVMKRVMCYWFDSRIRICWL